MPEPEPIDINITTDQFFDAVIAERQALADMFGEAETSDDPDAVQLRAALGAMGFDPEFFKNKALEDIELAKTLKEEAKNELD